MPTEEQNVPKLVLGCVAQAIHHFGKAHRVPGLEGYGSARRLTVEREVTPVRLADPTGRLGRGVLIGDHNVRLASRAHGGGEVEAGNDAPGIESVHDDRIGVLALDGRSGVEVDLEREVIPPVHGVRLTGARIGLLAVVRIVGIQWTAKRSIGGTATAGRASGCTACCAASR